MRRPSVCKSIKIVTPIGIRSQHLTSPEKGRERRILAASPCFQDDASLIIAMPGPSIRTIRAVPIASVDTSEVSLSFGPPRNIESANLKRPMALETTQDCGDNI